MMLARKGEKIKDHKGKVIATVAEDIHTGMMPTLGQFHFEDGRTPEIGNFLPEDVMEFIRGRMTRGIPEDKPASKPTPTKKRAKK